MSSPHSWSGLTIATPDSIGAYARCRYCALVIPLSHVPLYQGRDCEALATLQLMHAILDAADRTADDAALVDRFLASLDGGPRHA